MSLLAFNPLLVLILFRSRHGLFGLDRGRLVDLLRLFTVAMAWRLRNETVQHLDACHKEGHRRCDQRHHAQKQRGKDENNEKERWNERLEVLPHGPRRGVQAFDVVDESGSADFMANGKFTSNNMLLDRNGSQKGRF